MYIRLLGLTMFLVFVVLSGSANALASPLDGDVGIAVSPDVGSPFLLGGSETEERPFPLYQMHMILESDPEIYIWESWTVKIQGVWPHSDCLPGFGHSRHDGYYVVEVVMDVPPQTNCYGDPTEWFMVVALYPHPNLPTGLGRGVNVDLVLWAAHERGVGIQDRLTSTQVESFERFYIPKIRVLW